jgi:hypothetical protein
MTAIYFFHHETREFMHEGVADVSELDGELLVPSNATEIAPPAEVPAGQVAVFATDFWFLRESE